MKADSGRNGGHDADTGKRPEGRGSKLTRRLEIFFAATFRQYINQRIPGQAKISKRHPSEETADREPDPISLRTQIMDGEGNREKTDKDVQGLGNKRGGGGDTSAAISFETAIGAGLRENGF